MSLSRHTQLAILQQSEYLWPVFQQWIDTHPSYPKELQPHWTLKAKALAIVSQLFFFLPVTASLNVSLKLLHLPEYLTRWFILRAAKQKLRAYQAKGLTVIAIAGSYGKTSTKMITRHLLSKQWQVCATPDSYNTPLGIARVIKEQLKETDQLFVVEFGEFLPGDIQKLITLCQPSYGILSPMGRQHLEILGGLDELKSEMNDFVCSFQDGHILVHEQNLAFFPDFPGATYGDSPKAPYRVIDATISRRGTSFEAKIPAQQLKMFSPIYGKHQAINSLPALWVSDQLQGTTAEIAKHASTLPYIERRHQPTFAANDVLILDNSFNTNPDAVVSSLELVSQLSPSKVFVITLGFVEQGPDAAKIHYQFGQQLAKKADAIGLILGPHTEDIKRGYVEAGGSAAHIYVGETQEAAFAQLQPEVIPGSVILFEGGFQEIFS